MSSDRYKLTRYKQSNRSIYRITQDKVLWGNLLHDLRPPLPRTLRSRRLENVSYSELEDAVLRSHVVEHQWLKQRKPSSTLSLVEDSNICHLDILDDRWIICIPSGGPLMIWDTQENSPKLCELTPNPFYRTGNAAVAVDPHQGDIVIVLQCVV